MLGGDARRLPYARIRLFRCVPHIAHRCRQRFQDVERECDAAIQNLSLGVRLYGLGDKAYVGCPEFITEFKGKNLSAQQNEWNLTVQHYRGRVEHLIGELVSHRATLKRRWRGNFTLLAAIMKICAHMTGLQERMKGPHYDCFGPWLVCPPDVVRVFG